jgi:hypothetical protein
VSRPFLSKVRPTVRRDGTPEDNQTRTSPVESECTKPSPDPSLDEDSLQSVEAPEMTTTRSPLIQATSPNLDPMAVGTSSYGHKVESATAGAIRPLDAEAPRASSSDVRTVKANMPELSTQHLPRNTQGVGKIDWSSVKNPVSTLNEMCLALYGQEVRTYSEPVNGRKPGQFQGLASVWEPRTNKSINIGHGTGSSRQEAMDAAVLAGCRYLHAAHPGAIHDISTAASSK